MAALLASAGTTSSDLAGAGLVQDAAGRWTSPLEPPLEPTVVDADEWTEELEEAAEAEAAGASSAAQGAPAPPVMVPHMRLAVGQNDAQPFDYAL